MEQSFIPHSNSPLSDELTQRFNRLRVRTTQPPRPTPAGEAASHITERPVDTGGENTTISHREDAIPARGGAYYISATLEDNITPYSLCATCQAIPSKHCLIRDEIDRAHKGKLTANCFSFQSTESKHPTHGSDKRRTERVKLGAYRAFSNVKVTLPPGHDIDFFAEREPYTFPFEEDSLVKPYLYGNWWSDHKDSPVGLLIGFGVRIGKSPLIEDGESNIRNGFLKNGLWEDFVHLRGTHLRLRRRLDSPLKEIAGFLRHLNPSDTPTIYFLKSWISTCNQYHKCEPSDTPLPTRVLDVGDHKDLIPVIRLVQSGGQKARFVALSHCWGTSHRITLTTETSESLQKGYVGTGHLPRTFAEAVSITRTLGIRYLWIDSLCIFQDDPEDWEREAAQMAAVYENCYVCIAADSSTDDSTGCFPSQSARAASMYVSPDIMSLGVAPIIANTAPTMVSMPQSAAGTYSGKQQPFAITERPDLGSTSELAVSLEWMPASTRSNPQIYGIPHFGRPINPFSMQPLHKRGWTLQERLLSPRVFHICADQAYWECKCGIYCEDGSRIFYTGKAVSMENLVDGQNLPYKKHGLGSMSGWSLIEGYPPVTDPIGRGRGGWLEVVEDYSSRKLTKEDDKLPALSGLANRLSKLTGDTYYAGLWRNHILEDLSWRVCTRSEQLLHVSGGFVNKSGPQYCFPKRSEKYQAPTWSWASVESIIKFIYLDFERIVTTFIDAETTPVGKDRSGRVCDGWIKLKGPLIEIYPVPPTYKPDPMGPLGLGVFSQFEHSTGTSYGEAFFDLEESFPCTALFLDPSNALLLQKNNFGNFVRVGLAKFMRTAKQRKDEDLRQQAKRGIRVSFGPLGYEDAATEVTIV